MSGLFSEVDFLEDAGGNLHGNTQIRIHTSVTKIHSNDVGRVHLLMRVLHGKQIRKLFENTPWQI